MKKTFRLLILFMCMIILLPAGLQAAYAQDANSDKQELILGTSADFPPYEFHTTIDGQDQIVGFDIEIAKAIAEKMGAELVIQDMGFDSLLPALQSGRVDLVISGMTPTEERRQSIDFSDPYYKARQVVIVRAEDKDKYQTMADLENTKIGVQKGSIQEDIAMGVPNASITSLDKIGDIVMQLETERVDALIVEDTVAAGYLNDDIVLADAVPDESESDAAIGVQKGNTELLAVINETLAELKADDRITEMVEEASLLAAGKTGEKNILEVAWEYRSYYAKGIGYTLLLSALGVIFGFLIGLIITLVRMSGLKILAWLGTAYVEVLRGTPMLVQLMIIHYGLALVFGINLSPLQSGVITLSINSSAYLAEIFRAGIQGVDKGQMEAARSLGMTRGASLRHIILPQAMKTVLPAIGNEFITIIKESSIISVIGMMDIMYQANTVRSITYQGLSPYIIAAVIYFILTFMLSKLLGAFERKLRTSDKR
ncbi:ABC transporter substrate-binding protein/permease [Paenibacillus sp. 453mf]|uniref:ABC transporter substrate-binding protein/permease n=1 Tax=Paenibacillus sp. 453mf TaxID=1761874 RepID=UPI0008EAA6E9|nr:ABC transporter substrate-binding protein/permease [Paenibacillus sp. 453mf]SFS58073.1 amino acid ABC transporter substrate-binding protein, PAAT family /amino acid ABC transporter membrane protein, PAAT family [Paenibacillus sp. 453mf]